MQNLDPASKVIQALSADAQISKLRNEIKYQDLVNEDYRLLLESRKEETPVVNEDGTPSLDENGNPRFANWYRFQRAKSDLELEEKGADASQKWENVLKSRNEREVYEAVKPFLKKMPEKQLKSLEEDINAKVANNTLLEADVELMKKYGISPSDKDGFQSLLRIALRDPDALHRILDQLIQVGPSLVGHVLRNNFDPVSRFQSFVNGWKGYGNSHKNGKTW